MGLYRILVFLILFSLRLFAFDAFAVTEPATVSAQKQMWDRWENIVFNSENLLPALDASQRRQLLQEVTNNEVAKFSALKIYDPPQNDRPDSEIGYCFGRAMAAHLIARKMGLEESSMKKIFAAGDMQNNTVRWRFHMATLVRGEDSKYYAIDPIIPKMVQRYNVKHGTQLDPLDPVDDSFWTVLISENYDNTSKILEKYPELSENPDFTGTIKFYEAPTDTIMVDMREVPATLDVENGERIIEILFDPGSKSGFTPVYFPEDPSGKVGYWSVDSAEAARRYFMVKEEPLTDQFSFFSLSVDILFVKDDVLDKTKLRYLYNGKLPNQEDFQHYSLGYFPSLLKSIELLETHFGEP